MIVYLTFDNKLSWFLSGVMPHLNRGWKTYSPCATRSHSLYCKEHTSLYIIASDGNMIAHLTLDLGTYLESCPHLNWGWETYSPYPTWSHTLCCQEAQTFVCCKWCKHDCISNIRQYTILVLIWDHSPAWIWGWGACFRQSTRSQQHSHLDYWNT